MFARTKISAAITAISFCILLIPTILQKEFSLTSKFDLLLIIVFAVSSAAGIFALIKDKNGFSAILVFASSITLTSLLLNTYDFKKIFLKENNFEEISDSLSINQNINTQPTEKQLLNQYVKATGNAAIAVVELNKNYTVFLLSINEKTPPDSSVLEFDYEISQFASPELEARKSFSAIVSFNSPTDFSAKVSQNSVNFFSDGKNIGTQTFDLQFKPITDEKELNLLIKIMRYL
ncbi:MAG: hypothetical protein FWF72_00635 [Paludibacter sp.]|nr:hypothetical protein [Paludibacter sp.]